jgi:hypothetical protein
MPQLHLYVPEDLAERIRARARAQHKTVSRVLGEMVRSELGEAWPESFFDRVVGGWEGEPLDRPPQGVSETRGAL